MKIRITLLLFLTTVFIPNLFSGDLSFRGYVRNYTGIILNDDMDYSIVQNTFNLTMEYSQNDFAFLVNPAMTMNFDGTPEFNIREAYVDIYLENMDLRIGKQQIIWGKADGAFITDVVSPKDLTEFLLPEFEEIRIGITAVKAEIFLGNSSLELIGVPVFTANKMPAIDSIWNTTEFDFSGSGDSVELKLTNSELFARYSLFTSFVDFELMGGYMWDDEPTLTPAPPTQPLLDHKRLRVVGGSFSSLLGDFVIRGEGALYTGKYFQVTPPEAPVEKQYISYLAGIDLRQNGWYLSTQFIQKYILDYNDEIVQDHINSTMTFVVSKDVLRETLHFEVFTYVEFNNLNALIRPKVAYDLTDGLEISLGSNIFAGEQGTFGQFNSNNMIYTKLKFSF